MEDVFVWFCLFLPFLPLVVQMVLCVSWCEQLTEKLVPAHCVLDTVQPIIDADVLQIHVSFNKTNHFVCQCFKTSFLLLIPKTARLLKDFPRVCSA